MLIKDLKKYINRLPDHADIVIQKRITNKWVVVAPVLKARLAEVKDENGAWQKRLVLMNMKPLKKVNKERNLSDY